MFTNLKISKNNVFFSYKRKTRVSQPGLVASWNSTRKIAANYYRRSGCLEIPTLVATPATPKRQAGKAKYTSMEESLTCDISSEENCASTIETNNFWTKEGEFTAVKENKSLTEKRYFQNKSLEKYDWLHYYLKKRSVFCTVCRDYAKPNDSSPFIYRDDADEI